MFWKVFSSIIVPLFILVPIFIGLLKIRILPATFKIIWFYLLITAVISTAATIIGRVFHINNMPLLHLFTLIEGLMLIWFYRYLFNESKKKWFFILQIAFGTFCILNALFFQSIYLYSSYTRYAESIICILFALKYFAELAQSDIKPLKLPAFYFNTGIFLYFSGSFILFIFSNLISQKLSASTMLIFWTGHSTLVLLMYILFSIGFIKCKK
jgi:hypothetical protein